MSFKYKKDRFIVEDMIIPCMIEFAMGNNMTARLTDNNIIKKGSRPDPESLIIIMTKFIADLPEGSDKNGDVQVLDSYKIIWKAITDAAAQSSSMSGSIERRIGRLLSKINQFFRDNKFNTRKILLLTIEWARILHEYKVVEITPDYAPVLVELANIYDEHLPEHQDNYEKFKRSTLKQAVRLHNIILSEGYFQGFAAIEMPAEAA